MTELQQSLINLIEDRIPVTIIPAKVLFVDTRDYLMNVEDLQGLTIPNVRLNAAAPTSAEGTIIYPAVDSWVLIGKINNSPNEYVLISHTQLDQYYAAAGASHVNIFNGSILVKSDQVNLGATGGEPVVKGTTLNTNLTSLNENLKGVVDDLRTFCQSQITAISTAPTLAPLQPAYQVLNAALGLLSTAIQNWEDGLEDHLSDKVKTD